MARRVVVPNKSSRDQHAKENNLKDSNIASKVDPKTLKGTPGTATIINGDGSKTKLDVVNMGGTNYNLRTGERIINYGNSSSNSVYNNSNASDVKYSVENGKGNLVITMKPDPKLSSNTATRNDYTPSYTPSYSEPDRSPDVPSSPPPPPPPPPPPRPSRPRGPDTKTFNKPAPTITSSLKTVKKYEYFFGVDKLKLQKMNINNNSCLVTREIEVSGDCEYIKLNCDYSVNEFSSVEFYVIHNNIEYPIIPTNDDQVRNEKVFNARPTRFKPDIDQEFLVREDGAPVERTDKNFNVGEKEWRTVSYTPLDIKEFKKFIIPRDKTVNVDSSVDIPKSVEGSSTKNIQIKVIVRLYDKFETPPTIFDMRIQEYGGSSLWKDNI